MLVKIKVFLRETPNSVLFWNGLVLLGLIMIGFISMPTLAILLALGSCLTIAIIIDTSLENKGNIRNHLWINFMPIIWFTFLIVTIIDGIITLYHKFIIPFNKWLNKSKE